MMMDRVLAVILGGGRGMRLMPLTKLRAKPAVPIAGKFRLIDIPISNCINSGIKHMYVLTQFNHVSLHRHLNQTYKFDTFSHGFIEVLAAQQTQSSEQWYQGTADAVRQQLPHLRAQNMDHILILAGDHLYQMDYSEFVRFHHDSGADVTVAVKPVARDQAHEFGILKTDASNRIVEFREKPPEEELDSLMSETGDPSRPFLASMGIYVFNRGLLVRLLSADNREDFGRHVIPYAIDVMNVKGFSSTATGRTSPSNRSYRRIWPDRPVARVRPVPREKPIYTRPALSSPSSINGCSIKRPMVCEGCIIDTCEIERSIIGIRSRIAPHCSLRT